MLFLSILAYFQSRPSARSSQKLELWDGWSTRRIADKKGTQKRRFHIFMRYKSVSNCSYFKMLANMGFFAIVMVYVFQGSSVVLIMISFYTPMKIPDRKR